MTGFGTSLSQDEAQTLVALVDTKGCGSIDLEDFSKFFAELCSGVCVCLWLCLFLCVCARVCVLERACVCGWVVWCVRLSMLICTYIRSADLSLCVLASLIRRVSSLAAPAQLR